MGNRESGDREMRGQGDKGDKGDKEDEEDEEKSKIVLPIACSLLTPTPHSL